MDPCGTKELNALNVAGMLDAAKFLTWSLFHQQELVKALL